MAALRSGALPKWLYWWGIIGGFLVTIVLLRYLISGFSFAMIGYPIVVLWFAVTGVYMFRKAGKMSSM